MNTITQPLRNEHKELYPHIESLREVGDAVSDSINHSTLSKIDDAYEFLAYHLIPHAKAEDAALYPVVQKAMGATKATETMSRDHVEVGQLVEELGQLRKGLEGPSFNEAQTRSLRRVLYGLYTLVKLHFEKEEKIYLPLLDEKLTGEEAQQMFENMEAAAQAAKHQHSH